MDHIEINDIAGLLSSLSLIVCLAFKILLGWNGAPWWIEVPLILKPYFLRREVQRGMHHSFRLDFFNFCT